MVVNTGDTTLTCCVTRSRQNSKSTNRSAGIDTCLYEIAYKGCCCGGCLQRVREVSIASQVTIMGNSLLHIHLARPDRYEIKFVESLLEHTEEMRTLLWQGNLNGDIPLHLAARNGHQRAVDLFIQKADTRLQEMLTCTNKNKDTALHEASRQNRSEVVKSLIEAGKLCRYYANNDHETPLYLAAESGSDTIVDTIVDNMENPRFNGPCGRNALHAAILSETAVQKNNNTGMMRKLLTKDSSLLKKQDDRGMTAFHFAASKDDGEYIDILLKFDDKNEKSAVYIKDELGRTALHIGVLQRKFDHVKKLASSRPGMCEVVDNRHQNVVHYIAKKTSCPNQLEYFLSECDIYWRTLINDKDVDGNTPLHVSAKAICSNGTYCVCSPLQQDLNFFKMNSRAFNKNNQTAGDILTAHKKDDLEFRKGDIIQKYSKLPIYGPGNRIIDFDNEVQAKWMKPVTAQDEEKIASNFQKGGETHLIVATLIVTLSFAVGIAVPGGPNQELGPDQGTPLLTRKTAFKAFMVADAIAMTLSTTATLLYFIMFMSTGKVFVQVIFWMGGVLTVLSLGGVMIAFTTGVYATIYQSKTLATWVLIIGSFFFIIYVIVFSLILGTIFKYRPMIYPNIKKDHFKCKFRRPPVK